jgi:hypothetical protein
MIQVVFFRLTRVFLLLITTIFLHQFADAQIRVESIPFNFEKEYDSEIFKLTFEEERFIKQNLPENSPPLVGLTNQVDISPAGNGVWVLFPEQGIKIWRVELAAENADEVIIYFDSFEPGTLGSLFVFSGDRTINLGGFTQISRVKGKPFAIEPIKAERIIIQFETGISSSDYDFHISEIGLLRKKFSVYGFGTSEPCEVNVNCDEGSDWQLQKRGVARILVKQSSALFYCTGSLINNAKKDKAPFFLTANHCGEFSDEDDYSQWIFAFNYETEGCVNPLIEPASQTLTGSMMLAKAVPGTTDGSDFKLLKLLQDVPLTYNPYYNGWSRQNTVTSSGVGIHHPDGDIKKISTYTSQPVSSAYGSGGSNISERYWRVRWSQTENGYGVTEGGSSGSPLFDSNGRIVGLLTGGSASCDNTSGPDFYGKFSYGWESNGTEVINQIAPWLDPDGTGIEFIGGLGSDTLFVLSDFEARRSEISINQGTDFENLSSGKITQYEWYFEGGTPSSSIEEIPGTIFYEQYGTFDVQLIVSNETTSDTLLRSKYISVKPFLYPNPTLNTFELSFGVDLTDDIGIEIFDAIGRKVAFNSQLNGSKLQLQLNNPTHGVYILRVNDRFVDKNLKFIITR